MSQYEHDDPGWVRLLRERDPEQKLNSMQVHAIMGLARGESVRKVAKALGVWVSDILQWRRDPLFQRCLDHAAAAIFDETLEFSKRLVVRALEVESEALDATNDKGSPNWSIRMKAARQVLARQPDFAPKTPGSIDDDDSTAELLKQLERVKSALEQTSEDPVH